MTDAAPPRRDWLIADVIAWQAGYRVAAALVFGGGGVLLRVAGFVTPPPTGAGGVPWLGPDGLVAAVGVVGVYVAFSLLVAWRVVRRGRRGRPVTPALQHAIALADLALILALVALLATPAHYYRALGLAMFSILLTQLYLGARVAVLAFRVAVVAYALLLYAAGRAGAVLDWSAELWSMAVFGFGGGLVALVQASRQRRLARLVDLLGRAEEGDFDGTYGATDRRPDAVTVVGRAYDRMRTELATIVLTDPLSGCLNRRGLEQQLEREIARAERTGAEVALVAVDVDRFKLINDDFGHLVGDAVIREAGARLRATARLGDVVARVGGEEFLLVLPNTARSGAVVVAERVAAAFRDRAFPGVDGRRVTVSVGVVSDRVTELGVAEGLRARADEALYAAKRAGRDRVEVWDYARERVPSDGFGIG